MIRFIIWILGGVVHLWTIILAFEHSGFLAAIVSIFLPFLSEIYWVYKLWDVNTTYCYAALASLLLPVIYPKK
ncbi:hypothetical protein [Elizabethkingia sp. JS20170427COW]|uniref:hypothetical protein n=1 Tax=Elizabethkingia sp. JS20170427COW TaxID=2583851 RepID=UPI0011108BD7|nr:hypothetical protein [Elizabethkingia sp. JS20170427COW]QCX52540.1 hypothetical protein FGE20_01655 [Elizabethkingia sp. JS20170427COW]